MMWMMNVLIAMALAAPPQEPLPIPVDQEPHHNRMAGGDREWRRGTGQNIVWHDNGESVPFKVADEAALEIVEIEPK